jgi:hypothetical protein
MKRMTTLLFLSATLAFPACGMGDNSITGPDKLTEKPFAAGGRVTIDLDSGDCEVRLASDTTLRVLLSGNTANATTNLTINGTQAAIAVKNTPHNNFHCTIDVPKAEELKVSLGGGRLTVGDIATDLNVSSGAGDTEISVGEPNDYGSVDAAVGAGEIQADPFGATHSGIAPNFHWSGPGKRTLTVHAGAGRLVLRR